MHSLTQQVLRSHHKLYLAALLNRRNGNYKLIAYPEPPQLLRCNNNARVITTKHDANTKRSVNRSSRVEDRVLDYHLMLYGVNNQIGSLIINLATFMSVITKQRFAVILDVKAKTYGAKSFSKGKSRRADDPVDADKLKDFKKSLRPIELSFNDSDLSPESLNRAFDKAIEALADLLEDEDDSTSGSRPYFSFADPPSAKFTPINDATNKRKNDTRSFTLKDAATSTSSSNAGLAKRRRPSQPEENERVKDVSTERDHEEAAEA
ncbi:hypothetical protein MBM_06085 [Drepanopeziza brunnea f. sp. 'multigermtubi' MB_m1]|uniref:Uncharacterized protein n=1 Tax=Marssonina brunnea f. sp. multigermtubi (strain MB_m1) TaxID=1072389 RepID=K1XTZ2_MARBU|nr:uncharacterized protein MBM_06085 [Drepanopeziza brunnea f. sp. 'multigermtubi' MB_m1]EKD16074.1 hypothetical protein MBM_06085 [Drepanopeziza brunnea f. sp. 'multigermtubi' MB_m1]